MRGYNIYTGSNIFHADDFPFASITCMLHHLIFGAIVRLGRTVAWGSEHYASHGPGNEYY